MRALRKGGSLEVAIARSADEAVQCCRDAAVLVVEVVEDRLVYDLLRIVDAAHHGLRVIVISSPGETHPVRLLEAGAMALVEPRNGPEPIVAAVRSVLRGESPLDPALTARVVHRMQDLARLCVDQGIDFDRCERLSPRERDVLDLMSDGSSNDQIAAALGVSVGTVKTHVHKILRKLAVENRRLASAYWRLYRQVRG